MNNTSATKQRGNAEIKWGYAFAGALALGFAGVIQFAFGGLSDEMLENMPAVVVVPYQMAGKLGITVALALLGLGLILRDVWVNRSRSVQASASPCRKKQATRTAPAADDDLETGEPLPDQQAPAPGRKIAALGGRFEGRGKSEGPGSTGGPSPAMSEEYGGSSGGGQVVLASAKYLNPKSAGPGGNGGFRKGGTNHTTDE